MYTDKTFGTLTTGRLLVWTVVTIDAVNVGPINRDGYITSMSTGILTE